MKIIWISIIVAIGFVSYSYAQSNRGIPQVKIVMDIDAPIDKSFDYILPVDLSHIFKRYKRFPAIVKTNESKKWIEAGLSRTVFFEDGTTAYESMLSVVPSTSFTYRIENFTSPLRKLAKRVEGEYIFSKNENGKTTIEWTYKIVPKNRLTRLILKKVILKDLRVLLSNALTILKQDLESGEYINQLNNVRNENNN